MLVSTLDEKISIWICSSVVVFCPIPHCILWREETLRCPVPCSPRIMVVEVSVINLPPFTPNPKPQTLNPRSSSLIVLCPLPAGLARFAPVAEQLDTSSGGRRHF